MEVCLCVWGQLLHEDISVCVCWGGGRSSFMEVRLWQMFFLGGGQFHRGTAAADVGGWVDGWGQQLYGGVLPLSPAPCRFRPLPCAPSTALCHLPLSPPPCPLCPTQVGVRVEAEDIRTGLRYHCCSAYLTFVAMVNKQAIVGDQVCVQGGRGGEVCPRGGGVHLSPPQPSM